MSKCLLHLNAGNDRNGNPRRLYVVMENGRIVAVFNEGYEGHGAIPAAYKRLYAHVGERIDITPAQYRELKKRANETRRMMGSRRR